MQLAGSDSEKSIVISTCSLKLTSAENQMVDLELMIRSRVEVGFPIFRGMFAFLIEEISTYANDVCFVLFPFYCSGHTAKATLKSDRQSEFQKC